ncbi:MAG: 2-hydroxyacid dehydrogenase [Aestuariibacter sp.]
MKAIKVAMFSAKTYDQEFFAQYCSQHCQIDYFESSLNEQTVSLATGYDTVCVFVNDDITVAVIKNLHELKVSHIALRCAGFNNVDIEAAKSYGIRVSRVPAYSPEAVAEHTLALMLALGRKLHKAYNRVKEANFSLTGLLGFTFHGKTAGIVGTGKIGSVLARILHGMGVKVLCFDPMPDNDLVSAGFEYCSFEQLIKQSDVISLHCPLNNDTQHLISKNTIDNMKHGVMLINTSRGGLVDTKAIIAGLKTGQIGHLGLDVYEMESELFFQDLSCEIVQDDVFQRLMTFPNVLITGHQGFFTQEALQEIASSTMTSIEQAHSVSADNPSFIV